MRKAEMCDNNFKWESRAVSLGLECGGGGAGEDTSARKVGPDCDRV